ncbi:MAG: hypothetical protein ABSG93_04360 [Solirubrobacteraceae bacterium]
MHDFAQYPMPERFVVTYNDGLGRYEATPAEGPWADSSIPGVEAMMAIGATPDEAIANARTVIEHVRARGL